MLHPETVEPRAFSILERLMRLKILQPFSLVGGTALSLRYGHRTSVDLDLFCHTKFDPQLIVKALKKNLVNGIVLKAKLPGGAYSVTWMV